MKALEFGAKKNLVQLWKSLEIGTPPPKKKKKLHGKFEIATFRIDPRIS